MQPKLYRFVHHLTKSGVSPDAVHAALVSALTELVDDEACRIMERAFYSSPDIGKQRVDRRDARYWFDKMSELTTEQPQPVASKLVGGRPRYLDETEAAADDDPWDTKAVKASLRKTRRL